MTDGNVLSDTLAVLGREHTLTTDYYTSWALMRSQDDVERLLAALVPLSMVCYTWRSRGLSVLLNPIYVTVQGGDIRRHARPAAETRSVAPLTHLVCVDLLP